MKTRTWFVQYCSCRGKEVMKTRRVSCSTVGVEVRNYENSDVVRALV